MHDSQMGLFVSRYTEDYELHLPTLTLRAHPIVRHVLFVPGIYSMVTRYDMSLTHSTTTQPKQPQGIMHMQSEQIGGDSLHTDLRFLSSRPQASPRSNVDEHQPNIASFADESGMYCMQMPCGCLGCVVVE